MDRPEIIANKGYETFGEHFFNAGVEKGIEQGIVQGVEKGVEQERKKNEIESAARDKKIEDFLRSKGVSAELLKEALAIK